MPRTAEKYLRPDIIQQVRRLDLKARFIVEGFISGLHRSPYQGFSVEFSEHRTYVSGDDIRQIDWNVYAKTDRYYIRKYEAETNLQAYLLIDCSGSMDFATAGHMTKLDYAISLAAALGYMMVHQQDAVGLMAFNEFSRRFLPPRCKRSHLTNIIATLAQTRPGGKTQLAQAIHEVARRVARRGLMILFTDLLDDQPAVIDALHHLKFRGHDLIIFQVLDHSELTLDFEGSVRFHEPETGQEVQTDPQAIRQGYLKELHQFIAEYRRACQNVRADLVMVDNAMTFDKALIQYLIQRQGRF